MTAERLSIEVASKFSTLSGGSVVVEVSVYTFIFRVQEHTASEKQDKGRPVRKGSQLAKENKREKKIGHF